MTVLIFEGVQGVGKTALIDYLVYIGFAKKLPLQRTSASSREEYYQKNKENTMKSLEIILKHEKLSDRYIVDRFIASEYVFGRIVDRVIDEKWIKRIDNILSKRKVLTVYVYADENAICRNIWARRGVYIAELMIEKIGSALLLYEHFLNNSKTKWIKFYNDFSRSIEENGKRLMESILYEGF